VQQFNRSMLEIPTAVAARAAGESDPARVYTILAEAIRTALVGFADGITKTAPVEL
jgi:hypothetical protein